MTGIFSKTAFIIYTYELEKRRTLNFETHKEALEKSLIVINISEGIAILYNSNSNLGIRELLRMFINLVTSLELSMTIKVFSLLNKAP